jgi:acyl carrier protein
VAELLSQKESLVEARVKEILASKLGKPAEAIRQEDDLLADLGVDSLVMAELSVLFEEAAGTRIPGEALIEVNTVGDIVHLMMQQRQSRETQPSFPRPR